MRKYNQRTKTYQCWKHMLSRCLNPTDKSYKNYGGRGLTICDSWNDFNNFLRDMGLTPIGKEIDRIDNHKGYSPENCRWVTRTENARNRRSNRLLSYNGESMLLREWAKKIGTSEGNLYKRLKNWSLERALTACVMKNKSRFEPGMYSGEEE